MSAANSHAPESIGSYVIEHALAHGSMGTVYVARHSLTYARVALKVMRTEPTGDRQAEERFLREVRAAAQIGHEGIVKVQDAGKTADGYLFLAMELLTGETFEERLAHGSGERLTPMEWLLAMLEPLSAAHARSIVHRDLKPANVFIARSSDGSEHIKLLDFGLARDTREKSGTQTGIALGTPYYMSPEQAARPKDVSPASDVWSVGVMMYEVLTGHMPFEGETMHAVVINAAIEPHIPTLDRAPGLDPALAALVDTCLSKAPEQRPRDAGELRTALARLLADDAVRAELANAPARDAAESGEDGAPQEPVRMPFADTAIALAHDSRIQDIYPRTKSAGLGVWIGTFAVLGLAIAGFFWALERNSDHDTEASEPPPAPSRAVAEQKKPAARPAPAATSAPVAPTAQQVPEVRETDTASATAPVDAHPAAPATARRDAVRGANNRALPRRTAGGNQPVVLQNTPNSVFDPAPEPMAPGDLAPPPSPAAPVEPPAAPSGEAHAAPSSEPAPETAPAAPPAAEPAAPPSMVQPEPQPDPPPSTP